MLLRVYTVSEVAKASGVSVRALHHYDGIGLLKPGHVGENGYRYYGRDELLRLQQILFHRELGLPLEEIRQVLDDPGFDRVAALRAHRVRLMAEARRYRELVKTLDATLAELEGETDVEDKAMFRGFDPVKQSQHEAWLVERYGDQMQAQIDEANAQFKGWSQADFDRVQAGILGPGGRTGPGHGPGPAGGLRGCPRHHAAPPRLDRAVLEPAGDGGGLQGARRPL